MKNPTPRERYQGLFTGPTAVMTLTDARLCVAHHLGVPPLRFDISTVPEDEAHEAINAVASYWEVRHKLEQEYGAAPPPPLDLDEVREMLAPPKRVSKPKPVKITPNNLWRKPSY